MDEMENRHQGEMERFTWTTSTTQRTNKIREKEAGSSRSEKDTEV